MQFIINGTCSFMSSLTVLSQTLSSVVHASNKKKSNGDSSGCLQQDKNNEIVQNRHPKKWSLSLSRGGRLHESSNCYDLTAKTLVVLIGSRLWEVVAHGGATVCSPC